MGRGTLSHGALWTRKGNSRPCKLARGMMNTSDRSGHGSRLSDDANKLAVYGTCDALAGIFRWNTKLGEKRLCPCCGAWTSKLVLSDSGRLKLKALRRKRAGRVAA